MGAIEASQHEASLREQLKATEVRLAEKEAKIKNLRLKLVMARNNIDGMTRMSTMVHRARRLEARVLHGAADKVATVMQELGLFPGEWNRNPNAVKVFNVTKFLHSLVG